MLTSLPAEKLHNQSLLNFSRKRRQDAASVCQLSDFIMQDRVLIRDLLLRCVIGINEHERNQRQDVLVNVDMWADLSAAAASDDVSSTVDYKVVTKEIISSVEKSSYFLLESLASSIADICLSHEKVERVRVLVEKPGALRFARSVGIELTREKKGKYD